MENEPYKDYALTGEVSFIFSKKQYLREKSL